MRLLIPLALCVGCAATPASGVAGSFSIAIRSSVPTTGIRPEGGLVSDCVGILDRDWVRAIEHPLAFQVDADVAVDLPEGEYGLAVRFVDANCEVVAFGCLPVSTEPLETMRFVVDVERAALGSSCGPREECTNGTCTPLPGADAGPPLPDRVTLSPDGQGYCARPEGFHCGCMSLEHYCDTLPCTAHDFVCDYPLGDLRDETDEHGCVRFVLFDSGDSCP